MKLIVRAHDTRIPESVRTQAIAKIEKLRRYFERITMLEIDFTEGRNSRVAPHEVAVTLTMRAHVLRAHASGPDVATAVDAVLNKIETQVRKLKDRRTRRGERTSRPKSNPRAGNLLNRPIGSAENSGDGAGPVIAVRKRFPVKPMTPEEAILEMRAAGQDFFAFINAESNGASVVYRRGDGSFGLIEPE
jgi:ribosome hibernation promoting factor